LLVVSADIKQQLNSSKLQILSWILDSEYTKLDCL
jgi:hypothetical protein